MAASGTFLTGVDALEETQNELPNEKSTPRGEKKKNFIPPEDGEQLIRLQRRAIERMTNENEQLREELVVLSKCHKDSAGTSSVDAAKAVAVQSEFFNRQVDNERRRLNELEKNSKVLIARVEDLKAKSGSAAVKPDSQVRRHIRILEDRLDRAIIRFNDCLGVNKALREEIDNLRRERSAFEEVVDKMTKELHRKKEEIAKHTEMTNIAYEARDLGKARIRQLNMERTQERDELVKKLKEIDEEMDRLDQQHAKSLELAEAASKEDEARQKRRFQNALLRQANDQQQDDGLNQVRVFQEAFQQIKEATGVADVIELVNCFIDAEDENFSLFNFMNELHTEAARLDEQIADLRRELDDFNGTNSDSSRRSLLKNLEVRLAQTEERSRLYEEKFEEGSRSLRESQVIIEKIHKHIGAAAEMSPQQDMDIGNHGVTESNMMIYLGLIEQRLATMLRQQKIHFTSSEYDTPRHSGLGGVSTMTVPPAAGARGQSSASPTFGVSSHAPVTVDPPQVNGCSFFLNNIQFYPTDFLVRFVTTLDRMPLTMTMKRSDL